MAWIAATPAVAQPVLSLIVVRSPLLAQRASDLLRELTMLVCGADEEELQYILVAIAGAQALVTARLREERALSASPANGAIVD